MESIDMQLELPIKKSFVTGNLRFNCSHDFQLTEQDQEIANQELNESEGNKYECLQKLKEKLASIKHMRCRTDDAYLLRYLRWAKYDCDKACKAIKKLYLLRNKHPEWFLLPSNLDTTSNLDLLLDNFPIIYMPYRDDKGRIIFWMDFQKWNLDEMTLKSLFAAFNALADIITMNPHVQVKGCVGVWDCRGVRVRHLSVLTHTLKLWTIADMLQNCYPWRVQQVVVIHCNSLIMAAYSVVRPFLKKKIADRIKLLGSDMTEVHQYLNPAVLPQEYGGTLEDSECRITNTIINNLPYLEYERSFGFQSSS